MRNLIAVDHSVQAYVDIGWKQLGYSRPAFQGHSNSSELTRIDRVGYMTS